MKLQQQSHATLKSELQDHKAMQESISMLCEGKQDVSDYCFSLIRSCISEQLLSFVYIYKGAFNYLHQF